MNKYYRYYKYIRQVNPHIPAYSVLTYVKAMDKSGLLDKLSIN